MSNLTQSHDEANHYIAGARKPRIPNSIAVLWERLIAVDVPDEELSRLGRLFNSLMAVGILLTVLLSISFFSGGALGRVAHPIDLYGGLFPISMFAFGSACIIFSKRGYIQQAITAYSVAIFIALFVAVTIFDGITSPGWLLFVWAIGFAGILLEPVFAIWGTLAVILYYGVLAGFQISGLYTPILDLSREGQEFLFIAFGLTVAVLSTGLLTYINMVSLRDALSRARQLRYELETQSQTLEQRIVQRTTESQQLARGFELIAELVTQTTSIVDFDEMLQTVTCFISENFEFPYVGLSFVDAQRKWIVLDTTSVNGEPLVFDVRIQRRIGEEGIVGLVAEQAMPYNASDTLSDLHYIALELGIDVQSEIALPLLEQGVVTGVLDVRSDRRNAFSDQDRVMLQSLVETLSIIIENSRRYQEIRQTLERLSQYEQQESASRWRQLLLKHGGHIGYLYDRVRISSYETATEEDVSFTAAEIYGVHVYEREDGTHMLLAPIKSRGQAVGRLTFESDTPWSDEDVVMVDAVVSQLALALDNARLLDETRRSALLEQTAGEITGRIRAEVDIESVLQRALTELGKALDAEEGQARLTLAHLQEE
ncbi:MAG: GAF domain-containing protein [Anaerolineae bacterium]|nr:GAF domain-containing protein [Anaerolineae bacterium]